MRATHPFRETCGGLGLVVSEAVASFDAGGLVGFDDVPRCCVDVVVVFLAARDEFDVIVDDRAIVVIELDGYVLHLAR